MYLSREPAGRNEKTVTKIGAESWVYGAEIGRSNRQRGVHGVLCADLCRELDFEGGAARRAVIPCADRQKAGICSRLRRVRAAERWESAEWQIRRHSAQRQPPSGDEERSR